MKCPAKAPLERQKVDPWSLGATERRHGEHQPHGGDDGDYYGAPSRGSALMRLRRKEDVVYVYNGIFLSH